MSLLNKASLIQIPSGYKDGTLYSAKPTNGDGDFTFSRGSNLAATRVNSEGLIEKGRENVLLQSNTFDTTWVTSSASVNGGQSGYDGSSDAWLLSKTGDYGRVEQNTSASGIYTLSVYAKSGTLDWLSFENSGISADTCFFDLSNGVVGSKGAGVVFTSIQSIGNGWYRCSAIFNGAFGISRIQPSISDGVVNGTNGNIYIQDAQLEQGLVATDYIETTTTTEQAGILEDMPRLDYSGGSCPSLLLEPQRSNLLPHSEYFSASSWLKSNVAITDNATTSPEGVDNAVQITENASGLNVYTPSDTLSGSASSYTYSAFLKQGSLRYGGIRAIVNGFANRFFVNVDLQEGTITDTDTTGSGVTWSYDIEAYANGWYRVWISGTNTSGNIDIAIGLSNSATPTYSSGLPYYTGTGSDYIYAYGAMLEAGSYPTSYIPTYGGSSVTRSADSCSKTGISSLIGQTEGTLFYEFNVENISSQTNDPVLVYLRGTGTESYLQLNDTGRLDAVYYTSGATQCRLQKIISEGTHKVAFAYKTNDFIMYVDGVFAASDTSGAIGTLNEFALQYYSSTFLGKQKVNQATLFKTRLSNDELAALTTI
jgi:hypothetical protein